MEFTPEPTQKEFDDLRSHLKFMLENLGDSVANESEIELKTAKPENKDADLSANDLKNFYSGPFLIEVTF